MLFSRRGSGAMPAVLDFSAAVPPLGISEKVRQAAAGAVDLLELPPDPSCTALRHAIGTAEGIDPAFLYCAAEAEDLVWRLLREIAPQNAVVAVPGDAMYTAALQDAGCKVTFCTLWEVKNFAVGEGFLDAVTPETDCVLLGQPNRITGLPVSQQALLALIDKCAHCGTFLILDERLQDFSDNPMLATEKPLLKRYPNLILLKSPDSTHGMAGLRLACCMTSNRPVLARLAAAPRSCTLSVITQAAGAAAMRDSEYVLSVRRRLAMARTALAEDLADAGATVYPGTASFLLFRTPVPDLGARLAGMGFLVKDCSACPGLMPGFCRAALRSLSDNACLADAVRKILRTIHAEAKTTAGKNMSRPPADASAV